MKTFILCFLILFVASADAQEYSLYNQNFRGVKSVRIYNSETDSAGKSNGKRKLVETMSFDQQGNVTERAHYTNEKVVDKTTFTYDQKSRVQTRTYWDNITGSTTYTYSYRTDSTGKYTIRTEHSGDKITQTQSSYWDSLQKVRVVMTWYGESTLGAANDMDEYDANNRLMQTSSYNGLTSYRYDSLGNLNYLLIRQFEDGHCSAYMPFNFENTYANGRLSKCASKTGTTWFTYNEKGFITAELSKAHRDKKFTLYEGEYTCWE